ncbi:PLAC8-domain-containing protein [Xylariaceae sp. FL0662B]|nr:PLAC8-domain-containing protein [Xylariaceae sp. FL0662B]
MEPSQEKIATGPAAQAPSYQEHAPSPQPQLQYQYQQQPPAQFPMGGSEAPRPTAYGQHGGAWQAGLCSCGPCTTCLLGWCVPCVLLGQTSERIRDPSMQDADLMNSDCLIHGALTCFTGFGWIYALLKRGEIRERFEIEGSGCNDCCVSYWCPCCALIQQDNEVKMRQQNAQPVAQGYESQPAMQVPAPAPAH